jgi:hypothetical protein
MDEIRVKMDGMAERPDHDFCMMLNCCKARWPAADHSAAADAVRQMAGKIRLTITAGSRAVPPSTMPAIGLSDRSDPDEDR